MALGSYGKNLFTPKNIIIYVVIGVIVYAAIYFLFLSNRTTPLYQQPTEQTTEEGTDVEEGESLTVVLDEQNDSGQSGTATLTEEDGQVNVLIELGVPSDVEQPAHIHMGACPDVGDVVYPLANVADGVSETIVGVDLATLMSELPLAINVHKSSAESSVYTSCGDL